jgi:hypothetical protein
MTSCQQTTYILIFCISSKCPQKWPEIRILQDRLQCSPRNASTSASTFLPSLLSTTIHVSASRRQRNPWRHQQKASCP